MWRRVILVRANVSEERVAPIIVFVHSVLQVLVTANVPRSLILFALMMEATRSYETSALSRATRRHIPEDGILHSHRRENHKSGGGGGGGF
jgi:hypothetical protein